MGFYLASSSAAYYSVFPFCLTLGSPFCRLQVHSPSYFWCLPPVGEVDSVACVAFLMGGGLVPVFWWVGLDFVPLVGRTASGGVFWGVCELSLSLGSLSVNGWVCVPGLLVVWHGASITGACWPLGGVGS